MPKLKLSQKTSSILILVGALIVGLIAFFFGQRFTNLNNLGYFGIFLANLIGSATVLLPLPSLVATLAGGVLLNPFLSGVVSALGSSIGEMTAYFAGKGGKGLVNSNKNVQKFERWMAKYGLWTIFVLAAIPNPVFDAAGIVAGATGISIKKFFVIVFAGKLIKFLIVAYAGYYLAGMYKAAF